MQNNIDIDLEMSVVGTAMTYEHVIPHMHNIRPQHFSHTRLSNYWAAILHLWQRGKSPNIINVKAYCKAAEVDYDTLEMMNITDPSFTYRYTEYKYLDYAGERLIELWQLREVQALGGRMVQGMELPDAIQCLSEISSSVNTDNAESIADISLRVADQVEQAINSHRNNEPIPNAVYFGIPEVDRLGGFRTGDFVILAGRPAMGKSTLSRISLRSNAAKFPCMLLTKEMTKENITSLLASSEADIDSMLVREGRISDSQHNSLMNAIGKIAALPITVGYLGDLTNTIASIRRWRMQTDIAAPAVLYVDYLQQITNPIKGGSRHQEVAAVSNALKDLSLKLNIVTIALAQLSRSVEQRGGSKMPGLSDLKESGDIEQDADAVLFAYRPEYYGFMTDDSGNSTEGHCYLLKKKNRHGPVKDVKFGLELSTSRYYSLEQNNQFAPF